MKTSLWDGGRRFVLLERFEPVPADCSVLREIQAESTLRFLAGDYFNMSALRSYVDRRSSYPLSRMSSHELLDELMRDIRSGSVRVAEQKQIKLPALVKRRSRAEQGEGPQTTWVEFQVVWAEGGRGVEGVEFTARLPSQVEQTVRTEKQGVIRIDGLDPGVCDLETNLRDVQLENAVVEAASSKTSQPTATPAKPAEGGFRLIAIEEHKVKAGETLNTIAQKAGITWQHLAMFNWGTYDVDAINRHLFAEVGCRKKTEDGKNYVFDDADDPGIVFIPKRWNRAALGTAKRHVIRVERAELPIRQLFVRLHVDPEKAKTRRERFRLFSSDGAFEQTKTIADDLIKGDAFVDLMFTNVPARLSYSLEMIEGEEEPVAVVEELPFAHLDEHLLDELDDDEDAMQLTEDDLVELEPGYEDSSAEA